MTGLPAEVDATLAPVRAALLAAAQARAAEIRQMAEEQATGILAAARAEAHTIRAKATAAGESTGRSEAALQSARSRRQAHELVLAEQNRLLLELRYRVTASATALRTDPRYASLQTRLAERARSTLGADAVITESADGGSLAHLGSRRLDLSLPTLALGTLNAMAAELSTLWGSE